MDTLSGGGSAGIKSIPELRRAFEHIQEKTEELISGGGAVSSDAISAFRGAWQAEFGKQITDESAKSYLEHMTSMRGPIGKKRTMRSRSRKQSGGMAPLDHQTTPGVYGVYGNFPAYVSSGFDVGVPRISQLEGWGRVDTTPQVPVDIGSNRVSGGGKQAGGKQASNKQTSSKQTSNKQAGGKTKKTKTRKLKVRKLSGGSKFIMATNPSTVIADGVSYWQGSSLPPSPSPLDVGPRLKL
jgi:hypothetical protein